MFGLFSLVFLSVLLVAVALPLVLELHLSYLQFKPLQTMSWRYHWWVRWWWTRTIRLQVAALLWVVFMFVLIVQGVL